MTAWRHAYGFDQPVAVQYADAVLHALHGNLGRSIQNGQQVTGLIAQALPANLIGSATVVEQVCSRPGSGPLVSLAPVESGTAVLAVSGLSFLGYGASPPTPEWGLMVADGRDYLATSWWLSTFPGLAITSTVPTVNGLARALDHERRTRVGAQ